MKKIIDWGIYLIGLFVISSFIHELYHYSFCGGEFIAGFGFVRERIVWGGLTWCHGYAGGEIIPSTIELLILVGGVLFKKLGVDR